MSGNPHNEQPIRVQGVDRIREITARAEAQRDKEVHEAVTRLYTQIIDLAEKNARKADRSCVLHVPATAWVSPLVERLKEEGFTVDIESRPRGEGPTSIIVKW